MTIFPNCVLTKHTLHVILQREFNAKYLSLDVFIIKDMIIHNVSRCCYNFTFGTHTLKGITRPKKLVIPGVIFL